MNNNNICTFIGRLTADPELKQTESGLSVCKFSIAVNRPMGKNGETGADFPAVVAWRQTAEFICRYFSKGDPIHICSHMAMRSYEDKNGNKRTATEFVVDSASFLPMNKGRGDGGTASAPATAAGADDFTEVTADDLPFN